MSPLLQTVDHPRRHALQTDHHVGIVVARGPVTTSAMTARVVAVVNVQWEEGVPGSMHAVPEDVPVGVAAAVAEDVVDVETSLSAIVL